MSTDLERLQRLKKQAASRKRRRLIAAGQWLPPLVDPAPARHAVADLEAYGLSRSAIGQLAGVHGRILERLAANGQGKIHRDTEALLLAARFDLDRLRPKHHVSAAGTRRRLQALARIGYGLKDLAPLLGVAFTQVGEWRKGTGFVWVETARDVRDVYARLSMTLGPSPRAAEAATRASWPPPWAWDDDTIDHPDTLPDLACLRAPGGNRLSEDTLEDIQWVLAHEDATATIEQIAGRLKVTRDAISRALKRVEDQRAATVRDDVLGGAEGPLDEEATLELADRLQEVRDVRERFYANAEAAGHNVTRVAS